MIGMPTILACVFTLFVCLFLPLLILFVYALRHKKQGIVSAWLLGAAGFFVMQMVIRVPVLNTLALMPAFLEFSQKHYVLYTFCLAFTAGLFELAGRLAVAKLLTKNLTLERSLAAGMGHGGIEAMVLIGMTYVNNLIYILMINTGAFDMIIAQTAAAGVDVTQLYAIEEALLNTSPALFLLAAYERVLTMISHTAMSLLVCYGMKFKKLLPCALCCLLFHTVVDFTTVFSVLSTPAGGSVLSQTAAYILIYALLTLAAGFSLYMIRSLRLRWNSKLEDAYV